MRLPAGASRIRAPWLPVPAACGAPHAALPAPPPPPGAALPQGATNFAVFASNSWGVSLCLFTEADLRAGRVTLEVALSPEGNKTGDVWHVALPGLEASLLYGYRIFGSNDQLHEDSEGQRHDPVRAAGTRCRAAGLPRSGSRPAAAAGGRYGGAGGRRVHASRVHACSTSSPAALQAMAGGLAFHAAVRLWRGAAMLPAPAPWLPLCR